MVKFEIPEYLTRNDVTELMNAVMLDNGGCNVEMWGTGGLLRSPSVGGVYAWVTPYNPEGVPAKAAMLVSETLRDGEIVRVDAVCIAGWRLCIRFLYERYSGCVCLRMWNMTGKYRTLVMAADLSAGGKPVEVKWNGENYPDANAGNGYYGILSAVGAFTGLCNWYVGAGNYFPEMG